MTYIQRNVTQAKALRVLGIVYNQWVDNVVKHFTHAKVFPLVERYRERMQVLVNEICSALDGELGVWEKVYYGKPLSEHEKASCPPKEQREVAIASCDEMVHGNEDLAEAYDHLRQKYEEQSQEKERLRLAYM